MKKLSFEGSSLDDLKAFPDAARKAAGYELYMVQQGENPSDWKLMPGIGPGVREIRIHEKGQYRAIYLTKLRRAVYVLHAFQKKR